MRLVFGLVLVACSLALRLSSAEVDVSLTSAKALAVQIAAEHISDPRMSDARLYRNLDDAPAVWVLEFHSGADGSAYTVVAAAVRSLPPIVMHWQGLPWHADPQFLQLAQSAVGESKIPAAHENWGDLRWEGPFDLWVPEIASISWTETSALTGSRWVASEDRSRRACRRKRPGGGGRGRVEERNHEHRKRREAGPAHAPAL